MTVSIIIAVKTWQKNLEECVAKCRQLDYSDFEIIVLPDSDRDCPRQTLLPNDPKGAVPVKIISTGPVSPAKKRDVALGYAQGEILGFIDDDAYPQKDWLKNALENFTDPDLAAVGGPAITPMQDTLRQKASGAIFSSFLVSGSFTYRYVARKRRQVDDFPSCNFFVRKKIMDELGGFNTDFWPGEDTKLCLMISGLKKKIIYDPRVLVYHHRRPVFLAHLRQIASYALHRGYFAKRFPQTSLRIVYFLPTLFVLGLFLAGIFSLFSPFLRMFYFAGLISYLAIVLFFSFSRQLKIIPFVYGGIILSHLAYGTYFLKGLAILKLKEE